MPLQAFLPETGELFTDWDQARRREAEISKEIQTYVESGVWDLVQSDHPKWGRLGSAYPAYMVEGCHPGQQSRPKEQKRLERAREYVSRNGNVVPSKVL